MFIWSNTSIWETYKFHWCKYFFYHLMLEIALAILTSNDKKVTSRSERQVLTYWTVI